MWFEDGEMHYNKSGNNDAYKLEFSKNKTINDIKADTISINSILSTHKLNYIDYVKMDVEGAEYDIFQRNTEWLKSVQQLKIEVHHGEDVFNFIQNILIANGFETVKDTHHWSTIIAYKHQ